MSCDFLILAHKPDRIGPYSFVRTIGEGAFSLVELVRNDETEEYFACKIIPRDRLQTEALRSRFEVEIRVTQQLHHPGIVELFDLLSDDSNYYVIMEYCPNGDLFQHIIDNGGLSEQEARPIVRQVFEALRYVHSLNITHRDLKPENLLLDSMGRVKLGDFGLSQFIGKNGLVDTPCGSPCYASPECISGHSYDGKTTDVWSMGVIVYAMVTAELPWTKRNQAELFAQIRSGEYNVPEFLTDECQDFIRGLMTVDYHKRLTIEQAYRHEWLNHCPIQWPFWKRPSKLVSLRTVDKYFGREISEVDCRLPARPLSAGAMGMRKTAKMLKRRCKRTPAPTPAADTKKTPAKEGFRAAARNIITQGGRRPGAQSLLRKPNLHRRQIR